MNNIITQSFGSILNKLLETRMEEECIKDKAIIYNLENNSNKKLWEKIASRFDNKISKTDNEDSLNSPGLTSSIFLSCVAAETSTSDELEKIDCLISAINSSFQYLEYVVSISRKTITNQTLVFNLSSATFYKQEDFLGESVNLTVTNIFQENTSDDS